MFQATVQDNSPNSQPPRRRPRPKKTKNPGLGKSKFGNDKFGARVPDGKPENIKEILENVFEVDQIAPEKQKIVNRPKNSQNSNRPTKPDVKSSPLLGYKNTGGRYLEDGVRASQLSDVQGIRWT